MARESALSAPSIEVGNLVVAGITLKSGSCCVPLLEAQHCALILVAGLVRLQKEHLS